MRSGVVRAVAKEVAAGAFGGEGARGVAGVAFGLPRLTVALDLDHTLVHTTFLKGEAADAVRGGDLSAVPEGHLVMETKRDVGLMQLRPGLVPFLHEAAREADLVLFTAGDDMYGRRAAELLTEQAGMDVFVDVRTRRHCRRFYTSAGIGWTKDLSQLGTDLARTVLLDDKLMSFLPQPANGLRIEEFRGSPADDDLFIAQDVISELATETPDVRPVLAPVVMSQALLRLCAEFEERKAELEWEE